MLFPELPSIILPERGHSVLYGPGIFSANRRLHQTSFGSVPNALQLLGSAKADDGFGRSVLGRTPSILTHRPVTCTTGNVADSPGSAGHSLDRPLTWGRRDCHPPTDAVRCRMLRNP